MTEAPENLQKSSDHYTLAELQREIVKDEDWRAQFRYLPKASRTDLKFHLIVRSRTERWLLIGFRKSNERDRVYARVCPPSANGRHGLVDVCLPDGIVIGMHRAQIRNDTSLLQGIKYFEPFDQLDNIGSVKWRKSLRFLVLYYFLEQKLIDRAIFTRDGLESLQRACTSIAQVATRMGKKTTRPLLVAPKNVQTTEAQTRPRSEEDDEDEDFGGILVKREDMPVVLVKAPENDSMGAVSTMVRRDDNVASSPFPKTMTSEKNAELIYGHAPTATISACQSKRKRSADDHAMREKEHDREEELKLVCSRFKRLAQLKIESLQKEASVFQDTLNVHTMSLNEAVMAVSTCEKALLVAKARLEAVQAVKAATETRLEEVRSEVTKKSWIFQEGFESFYG